MVENVGERAAEKIRRPPARSFGLKKCGWQLPTMGWKSEGNVWRRRTPGGRNRPEERRRMRGQFPKPAVPRFFAGNQTGKAAASGSNSLVQRRTDGWLDFAGRTFLVFISHVNLQLSGQHLQKF
jgi:hypothetical protein